MSPARPALLTPAFARILAMQTLFGASQACFVLLPKFLAVELDATPSEIGAIAAIYSAVNVLLVPAVGVAVDRFGRRLFLLLGNGVTLLASLAFVSIDEVGPAIFLLRALQGAGFAGVFIGASALVADSAPQQRMSHALALLTATMHGTGAAIPLLVEPFADRAGWAPVFMAAAGCAAVALLLSIGVHNRPRDDGASRDEGPGIGELLARPVAWRTISVVTFAGVAVATLLIFIQPFAIERGIQRVAPFIVAYSAVAMAVRVFLGGLLDRLDRYRITVLSVVGYALLLFLLPQLDVGVGTLTVLGGLFGLVHGAFFPAFTAMNLHGAGESERGKVVAVANTGFNVGFASGNFGLGYAAAAWGYVSVYWIAGVGMTAALVLLLAVRGSAHWSLAREPLPPSS